MFAVIASASLGLLQPQVNDPNMRCVLDQLSPAVRVTITDEGASGGSGPGIAALQQALRACKERLAWDQESAVSFAALSVAFVIAAESRGRLQRGGIDPALVINWFDAQPVETQRSTRSLATTIAALFEHMAERGVDPARLEAQSRMLGAFVGALIVIEQVGAGVPVG